MSLSVRSLPEPAYCLRQDFLGVSRRHKTSRLPFQCLRIIILATLTNYMGEPCGCAEKVSRTAVGVCEDGGVPSCLLCLKHLNLIFMLAERACVGANRCRLQR
jgi:hypothetical protein